jgi:hypothetical protein
MVDVVVQAIDKPEALRGRVLVVFKDVKGSAGNAEVRKSVASRRAHEALLQELHQTREALQVTHEEMQTTVEELKSSNEELQSTNEELQVDQRGTHHLQGGTAVAQRGTADRQCRTAIQGRRPDLGAQRHGQPAQQHRNRHGLPRQRDEAAPLHHHATKLFKLIPGDVGRPLSDMS